MGYINAVHLPFVNILVQTLGLLDYINLIILVNIEITIIQTIIF